MATTADPLASAIEERWARGLVNRWWCIGPSALFREKPVALTRLGEKMVGWRDQSGRLRLVEDRCPHRGLPLSAGRARDEHIACRYHGVEVTGDGRVAAVPALPECELLGRKLIKSYPVIEHFQGVWAYFGDEAHPEPCPLLLPEELTSPEWTGFIVSNTWFNDYRYVFDNLADIMHTTYLHDETYTLGKDRKSDIVDITGTPTGMQIARCNDSSNIHTQEFIDTGAFFTRVGIAMPPGGGPGGVLRVIATVVPIDRGSCQFNTWRMRKVSGWQAAMFRFMFNMLYDKFTWEVIEQDREAIEAMPPWLGAENLYQHDTGVIRVRRYMRQQAEAQVRAMAK
jgi:phenylpropionate dioxygenase-like ring-hydroxylating dioxygenase large terminal subunit